MRFSKYLGDKTEPLLTLEFARHPGACWIGLSRTKLLGPEEVPPALVRLAGLVYGWLQFCVYGLDPVHERLVEESERLAALLSTGHVGPRAVLHDGEDLLESDFDGAYTRWSASLLLLHGRRDYRVIESDVLEWGETLFATDYLRYLVARLVSVLPAERLRDLAVVLRAMNEYPRGHSGWGEPGHAGLACEYALRVAEDLRNGTHNQSRADEGWCPPSEPEDGAPDSNPFGRRQGNVPRVCPDCGLGWPAKYFSKSDLKCLPCRRLEFDRYLPYELPEWIHQIVTGGPRDTVEGASGRFGYEPTNPIPSFEECGQAYYCACLRCPQGHAFWFHRLGSDGMSPDGHVNDVFELLCFGGETHIRLYFDFYHRGGSKLVPFGLSLSKPEGRGTARGPLSNFPEEAARFKPKIPEFSWCRFDLDNPLDGTPDGDVPGSGLVN